MTKHVLLDNVTHKNLKILTGRGANLGDSVGYTTIIPVEFRRAACCYPMVFRKNPITDRFETVGLLGLNQNENLFLDGSYWRADYIPLSIERAPFMIGYARNAAAGEPQAVIHIDMDHPRVSFDDGESIFLEDGGQTPYLERMNSILAELLKGVAENDAFLDALLAEELLEPFALKAQLKNQVNIEVSGFHTINEERLASLSGNELERLHRRNYLEPIYLIIASLSNLRRLIKMKEACLP